MNLLHGEINLMESSGKNLILTTHRIRYELQTFGGAIIKSIMLDELASCAIVRRTNPILLVLGIVCFLGALFLGTRDGGALLVGLIIGGVFVAAYFFNQQQVLSFASAGTTIQVQGMKFEAARDFIDRVEAAKNARYFSRT